MLLLWIFSIPLTFRSSAADGITLETSPVDTDAANAVLLLWPPVVSEAITQADGITSTWMTNHFHYHLHAPFVLNCPAFHCHPVIVILLCFCHRLCIWRRSLGTETLCERYKCFASDDWWNHSFGSFELFVCIGLMDMLALSRHRECTNSLIHQCTNEGTLIYTACLCPILSLSQSLYYTFTCALHQSQWMH